MNLEPVFSELLVSSLRKWSERKVDECILSISVPVSQTDPLTTLPLIAEKHQFRFLWDLSPGLCISAGGIVNLWIYLDQRGLKMHKGLVRRFLLD